MTRLARWLFDFDTFLFWSDESFSWLSWTRRLCWLNLSSLAHKSYEKNVKHSLNQVLWTWIVMLCVVYTFFFQSCKCWWKFSKIYGREVFLPFGVAIHGWKKFKIKTFFFHVQSVHNIFWRSTSILLWVRFYICRHVLLLVASDATSHMYKENRKFIKE